MRLPRIGSPATAPCRVQLQRRRLRVGSSLHGVHLNDRRSSVPASRPPPVRPRIASETLRKTSVSDGGIAAPEGPLSFARVRLRVFMRFWVDLLRALRVHTHAHRRRRSRFARPARSCTSAAPANTQSSLIPKKLPGIVSLHSSNFVSLFFYNCSQSRMIGRTRKANGFNHCLETCPKRYRQCPKIGGLSSVRFSLTIGSIFSTFRRARE
jgi:hypothetical protein